MKPILKKPFIILISIFLCSCSTTTDKFPLKKLDNLSCNEIFNKISIINSKIIDFKNNKKNYNQIDNIKYLCFSLVGCFIDGVLITAPEIKKNNIEKNKIKNLKIQESYLKNLKSIKQCDINYNHWKNKVNLIMKIFMYVFLISFLLVGFYYVIPYLKPNKPDLSKVVGPEGPASPRLKNIFDGLGKGLK